MNIDILVNKENKLDEYFIPNDMVKIYEPTSEKLDKTYVNMLVKEAYIAFKYMQNDALKHGYNIFIDSSYRSYKYQKEIFDDYLNKMGKEYTLSHVAFPGTSEHQTGLAIDIEYMKNNEFVNCKDEDDEIKWLKSNSYKYGYILRYPLGKEYITGYNYERWHYRYVGLNIAKYLFENRLTLEEYTNEKLLKLLQHK